MTEDGESSRERLSAADWVLVGLFCVILVIILVAVFFRYVVNQSLFWSDEVVRYLFVWFTLLGAALVLRDRRHIRVEFFVEQMPRGLRRAVEVAGLLLILAFNVFLVVAGFLWVQQTAGTYTPALAIAAELGLLRGLALDRCVVLLLCRAKARGWTVRRVGRRPRGEPAGKAR